MSDGELICVGLDLALWPDVKGQIARAFRYNADRMSIDDIEECLHDKTMQLWGIHDGTLRCVIVTEIVTYPLARALRVITVTGDDHSKWLALGVATLTAWGQENGCTLMEMTGRRGWEKPLMQLGWQQPQIMMTKQI